MYVAKVFCQYFAIFVRYADANVLYKVVLQALGVSVERSQSHKSRHCCGDLVSGLFGKPYSVAVRACVGIAFTSATEQNLVGSEHFFVSAHYSRYAALLNQQFFDSMVAHYFHICRTLYLGNKS